jgi:hypothetical protein
VEVDEVASRSYALTKVPKKLQADFDEMRDHRTRVLNRFRSGSAVVDTTFDHDVSSTLRYCGWLTGSHGPGFDGELTLLGVFGHASVAAHVESYLQWCMDERKCLSSSCANYASGLCAHRRTTQCEDTPLLTARPLHRINVLTYLLATDEAASPAEPSLQQMLNLRQQLESKAKIDKMYKHKNPNFIEWPAVQRARVKAIEEYNKLPKTTPPAKRIKQLNDLLCLLFHSLQPPDRVGCVHHHHTRCLPLSDAVLRAVLAQGHPPPPIWNHSLQGARRILGDRFNTLSP